MAYDDTDEKNIYKNISNWSLKILNSTGNVAIFD